MSPARRRTLAESALDRSASQPPCPFQSGETPCRKTGGVCSIRRYAQGEDGRLGESEGDPVITCPARFAERQLLIRWLSEIVGFRMSEVMTAREVPFMIGASTNKPAGMIYLMLVRTSLDRIEWYGLEIQAVYFSGRGMQSEFRAILHDDDDTPPFPDAVRRPDWRSSSAKRLMPQLQIKVPTLRRWDSKMAVAVDHPFFEAVGGPSQNPSHDLNDGDVIWLVPEIDAHRIRRGHWEVLTLEESSDKLLAARTISRADFENVLRAKLESP